MRPEGSVKNSVLDFLLQTNQNWRWSTEPFLHIGPFLVKIRIDDRHPSSIRSFDLAHLKSRDSFPRDRGFIRSFGVRILPSDMSRSKPGSSNPQIDGMSVGKIQRNFMVISSSHFTIKYRKSLWDYVIEMNCKNYEWKTCENWFLVNSLRIWSHKG